MASPKLAPQHPGKDLDSLVAKYPEVQLATLVDTPPEGENWVHEIKFDGYRLLGFVAGAPGDEEPSVRLRTRNGKDWTERFPGLVAALAGLKVKDAVLDLEAVILDNKGRSGFQALQAALGRGGNTSAVTGCVFDLLYLDGRDLTALPLMERKERLRKMLSGSKAGARLRYSDHVAGRGGDMLAKACEAGLEGIVSKEKSAPYLVGRQKSWLKIKCAQRQEFIVVGYSAARSGDRALGALYLGYKKNGALRYAGKVGTGFSMQSARDLVERFERIASSKAVLSRAETAGVGAGEYRSIQWVKPELLCEVSFTEWTEEGRIRHPSFQGLREDKGPDEVKKEMPVAMQKSADLVLSGIRITHPDRVISETGHVTKGELAEYYAAVAPLMLPHLAGRPLSLLRCPAGIGDKCFFQRNAGRGLGPDVHSFDFHHKGNKYEYLYLDDEKGLMEVVQMGAIELHPWGSKVATIDYPDRMIFDLDPAPDVVFETVKRAAMELRRRLRKKGLEAALKCTGGKGLHVTVPLKPENTWPVVKAFARALAEEMTADSPEQYIATMSKAKRTGKIFLDYLRNDYTATAIVDYGVRARPGAAVALPLEWSELKSVKGADQFGMKDVLMRLSRKTPKWPAPQSLPV